MQANINIGVKKAEPVKVETAKKEDPKKADPSKEEAKNNKDKNEGDGDAVSKQEKEEKKEFQFLKKGDYSIHVLIEEVRNLVAKENE